MAVKETDRRTIVDRSGVSKRVRIGKVEWPPRQEEVVKPEVEVGRLLISEQKEKGGLVHENYNLFSRLLSEHKFTILTITVLPVSFLNQNSDRDCCVTALDPDLIRGDFERAQQRINDMMKSKQEKTSVCESQGRSLLTSFPYANELRLKV